MQYRHIYRWGPGIYYYVFYWCIPLDNEISTKCKETSNLNLKLYLVIISAQELKVNNQKNICH